MKISTQVFKIDRSICSDPFKFRLTRRQRVQIGLERSEGALLTVAIFRILALANLLAFEPAFSNDHQLVVINQSARGEHSPQRMFNFLGLPLGVLKLNQVITNTSEQATAVDLKALVERLSVALRKLFISSSRQLGGDCAAHAYLAQMILADHGISSGVLFGIAAWRVGPGDGDVISHVPDVDPVLLAQQPRAFPYHAWLETELFIIDFSTYTLRLKASQLDELDGSHTSVAWCPDYLLMKRDEVKTFKEVANAPGWGQAFYQEIPNLRQLLGKLGFSNEANDIDLDILRLILRKPEIHVMGMAI